MKRARVAEGYMAFTRSGGMADAAGSNPAGPRVHEGSIPSSGTTPQEKKREDVVHALRAFDKLPW